MDPFDLFGLRRFLDLRRWACDGFELGGTYEEFEFVAYRFGLRDLAYQAATEAFRLGISEERIVPLLSLLSPTDNLRQTLIDAVLLLDLVIAKEACESDDGETEDSTVADHRRMKPKGRTVAILRDLDAGLSVDAISEKHGVSAGTIRGYRSRMSKGRYEL